MMNRRDLILGGVALLGGYALGKPTRSALGASGSNGGAAAGWVNPYITDGLVAQLDGEWNVEGGVHDPSATTWVDLVNGIPLTIVNGAFTNNSIVLTGGNIYSQSIPAITQAIASGEATIEYGGVFRPREGISYSNESTGFKIGGFHSSAWTSSSGYTQGATFWSKNNANSSSYGNTYPTQYETRWGWDDSMSYHVAPSSIRAGAQQGGIGQRACTVQMVISSGIGNSYVDTVFFNSAMVNTAATYKNSGFTLGSYTARSNMEYYFFRVYSRALTAAEIAANYAVDKARFGLP